MVVIGILAIVLTVSIPAVYRYFHPNPMQKALDQVLEACRDARELAVLQTRTTALVINIRNKSFSVGGASAPRPEASADYPELGATPPPPPPPRSSPVSSSKGISGFSLPEGVEIEGVGINRLDYTEDEQVEVRFYPKGTSDNFRLVLHAFLKSSGDERRLIYLDPITGHADYEVDVLKFQQHE